MTTADAPARTTLHAPSRVAAASSARERWATGGIVGGLLAVHLACTLVIGRLARFPNSFDELAHLSYVRSMGHAPALLGRFPVGPMLRPDGAGWTAAPNYLNHPSPYYLAMAAMDRAGGGDVELLRLANTALAMLALGLTLWGGWLLVRGTWPRVVFAAALLMFPKTAVVGAIVSNDNAALLASGLATLGIGMWTRRREGRAAPLLLAVALLLAGWTKLTAFISLLVVVGALAALSWRSGDRDVGRRLRLPALATLLGSLPTLTNMARYGRPLWHPPTFYVPVAQRTPMSLGGYALLFLHQMGKGWSVLEPAAPVAQLGLLALVGVALTMATRGLRQAADDRERACAAFVFALAPVLAMHFVFGWQALQEDGYREAAQVRYYYVLWPGFALALAGLATAFRAERARVAAPLIALALLAPGSPEVAVLRLWARGWPALV